MDGSPAEVATDRESKGRAREQRSKRAREQGSKRAREQEGEDDEEEEEERDEEGDETQEEEQSKAKGPRVVVHVHCRRRTDDGLNERE